MSSYTSLFRVLSPSRVQTKFEENSPPASPTLYSKRYIVEMSLFFVVLTRHLPISLVDIAEVNMINGKPVNKKDLTITHLKMMIYDAMENSKDNTNKAYSLKLWKIEDLCEENETKWEELRTLVESYTETNIEKFGGKKLSSTRKFIDEFPVVPGNRVHILVQPPPPVTTGTGKRPPEDSDEGQNSKRAKLADPKIIFTARKIMKEIMKLDENESTYTNPENLLSLPFPYPGQKKPVDRFAISDDGFFNFMGRKEFRNILTTINRLRSGTGYMKLFVYGTVGYGKSHILSAIACFLFRTGKRVVYIPDCRQLSVDPVDYVKSALFLAYHDDEAKINEINSCENFEDITNFCKKLQFIEQLYFIVDQMNALDENDFTGVNLDVKAQIRRELDKMANHHYYIMSSSANNKTMLHLMQKQTGELKIKLFGGFDKEEMKEWWKKHESDLPEMDDQQIIQIEDITGKIPLFLKLLLESSHKNVGGALDHLNQKLNSIIQRPMTEFSDNLQSKDNQHIWDRHIQLMSSFLTNLNPPLGYSEDDYDHRYFYIEEDICYYVCGLVRDCMANYLYKKDRLEVFIDINWIKSFKDNPSVKGFMVEKACLASISKNGIMANNLSFKVDHHKFFACAGEIDFSLSEGLCTFYLPRKWNQKSIDGLLALYKTDTLFVAPIQITFDKEGHSDSEGAFFSGIWPELKSKIPDNLNAEVIFIWITRKNGVDEEVEMKVRRLRERDIEINPDYVSVVTGFANVNRDIDRYLSQV